VALTAAGRALFEECVPLLRRLDGFAEQLRGGQQQLAGSFRITSTVEVASQSLARAVASFSTLHPEVRIEVVTSDRLVDLVKEGIDLAIRIGWLRDSSLRATRLGTFGQLVLGSPDYLARAGIPARPEDLARHPWVALTRLPSPLTWRFTGPGGERRTVRVEARLRVDTGATLRALLESGAGLSVVDSLSSAEALASGRLQRVLARWSLPEGGLYAVLPPGRHTPPVVRAFVEHYRALVRQA
jgi:DNA-binding transcriptional LysR family regulator